MCVTEMRSHNLAREKDVEMRVITKVSKDILAFRNILRAFLGDWHFMCH